MAPIARGLLESRDQLGLHLAQPPIADPDPSPSGKAAEPELMREGFGALDPAADADGDSTRADAHDSQRALHGAGQEEIGPATALVAWVRVGDESTGGDVEPGAGAGADATDDPGADAAERGRVVMEAEARAVATGGDGDRHGGAQDTIHPAEGSWPDGAP
jgi:hypothetical protein